MVGERGVGGGGADCAAAAVEARSGDAHGGDGAGGESRGGGGTSCNGCDGRGRCVTDLAREIRRAGAREAPKQEMFEGRFTPWKGGRLWAGKLGGTNAEVGFWPYLDFTKVASTAMREGGPRLNVDLLRVKW